MTVTICILYIYIYISVDETCISSHKRVSVVMQTSVFVHTGTDSSCKGPFLAFSHKIHSMQTLIIFIFAPVCISVKKYKVVFWMTYSQQFQHNQSALIASEKRKKHAQSNLYKSNKYPSISYSLQTRPIKWCNVDATVWLTSTIHSTP